jgi:hypothetical protein
LKQQTPETRAGAGWQRAFDDPIQLPDGRTLVTLHDAATYITGLPKKEGAEPEWQAAIEALMLVAELGGPTMFARIGVLRAFNRGHVRVLDPSRKDPHWGAASWPATDDSLGLCDSAVPERIRRNGFESRFCWSCVQL